MRRFRPNIGIRCSRILALAPPVSKCGSDCFRRFSVTCCGSPAGAASGSWIQTVDAVRLYGGKAIWKDVGQRLLDDTCKQRTGSHEDDGCWPNFET